jgi:hypothetical protein
MCALRRIGLRFTQFATATCGTIRLKLLKIGAVVTTVCGAYAPLISRLPYRLWSGEPSSDVLEVGCDGGRWQWVCRLR